MTQATTAGSAPLAKKPFKAPRWSLYCAGGLCALAAALSVIGDQGNWALKGAVAAIDANQGVTAQRQFAAFESCMDDSLKTVAASNSAGAEFAKGEVPVKTAADSQAEDRFMRDRALLASRCWAAKLSEGSLGEPLIVTHMMTIGQLSTAASAQERLGDASPMSAENAAWIQSQLAQTKRGLETAFAQAVERSEGEGQKMTEICGGALGRVRCAPLAISAASEGRDWRKALVDPVGYMQLGEPPVILAARADQALWRAEHPKEAAAQEERVRAALGMSDAPRETADVRMVEATMGDDSMKLNTAKRADPAPSLPALEDARRAQAQGIIAAFRKDQERFDLR
jgi:hypothetical protein